MAIGWFLVGLLAGNGLSDDRPGCRFYMSAAPSHTWPHTCDSQSQLRYMEQQMESAGQKFDKSSLEFNLIENRWIEKKTTKKRK